MSLRISQEDDRDGGGTTLRVEGSLRLPEAEMLETVCRDLQQKRNLVIDLAGVTFLDDGSASVLRRLKSQPGTRLTGLRLFTERMISATTDGIAERSKQISTKKE